MSALAFTVLGLVIYCEAVALGALASGERWEPRPWPFRLGSYAFEVAAVWLALKVLL